MWHATHSARAPIQGDLLASSQPWLPNAAPTFPMTFLIPDSPIGSADLFYSSLQQRYVTRAREECEAKSNGGASKEVDSILDSQNAGARAGLPSRTPFFPSRPSLPDRTSPHRPQL